MPRGPAAQRRERGEPSGRIGVLAEQQLGRLQPIELRMQRVDVVELHDAEAAAREVEPGEPNARRERQRREQARLLLLEQRGIGHRAGRDHAHDLARDRTLARGRIADLLADRDRLPELHEAREIGLRRMHGHAGHRNRLAGGLPALRERDVDELGRAARVVVEQLIEIAHPVEQQRVRKLRFDRKVLLHHGRVRARAHRARPVRAPLPARTAVPTLRATSRSRVLKRAASSTIQARNASIDGSPARASGSSK